MTTAVPSARDASGEAPEPGRSAAGKRVLMIVSSARTIDLADASEHETGFFAEEALIPYERFVAEGIEVTVATPDGRPPHADSYGLEEIFHYPDADEDFLASVTRSFMPDVEDVRLTLHQLTELGLAGARRVYQALIAEGVSPQTARERVTRAARTAWSEDRELAEVLIADGLAEPLDADQVRAAIDELVRDSVAASQRVAERLAGIPGFAEPVNLAELTPQQIRGFDAVFVPGGHGPMVDMADAPLVGRVLSALHEQGAVISALCHGPAALLSAPARGDGQWLFDGYRMTAFTDEEEDQTRLGRLGPPWYLETALQNAGAVFDDCGSAWASHVVVDRNLITGQNPQSVDAFADAILKRLEVL
jgi:putative intracellular protease/amidase